MAPFFPEVHTCRRMPLRDDSALLRDYCENGGNEVLSSGLD